MSVILQKPGPMLADEARQFMGEQIRYPNMAGTKQVAERALGVGQEVCAQWAGDIEVMHRRWRLTQYMLAGNTIDQGSPEDIHLPELYKMVETIVPRMVEVFFEKDPAFTAKPRKELKRQLAEELAALFDWQLDQTRFHMLVDPHLRDAVVCQVAPLKVLWDRRIKRRFRREWDSKARSDGSIEWTTSGKWADEVTYDGPSVRIVDPYDFIMDTNSTDAQEAEFVGDRRMMSLGEILRYGEMFQWENLREVKESAQSGYLCPNASADHKWTRNPTDRFGQSETTRRKNRENQYEVVNLFLKTDIFQEGDFVETELVIVNGRTVVCARQNITDEQVRPYVFTRDTNTGHSLYGVGRIDNAVRINQHYDQLSAILLKTTKVAGCPFGFVDDGGELPDSLYRVEPFRIYRGVGKIQFTQVPDGVLRSGPAMLAGLQRHIEETCGVSKLAQGQDITGGTATESISALQEGNRRLKSLARAFDHMLQDLLHLFHVYTRQFGSGKITARVLGKRAITLNKEIIEVSPDTLMHDVDFEFPGLKAMSTYGMRAIGLSASLNAGAQLIVQNPDLVRSDMILHDLFAENVGPEYADRYVRVRADSALMHTQDEENRVLLAGEDVEIHEADDHQQHIREMQPLLRIAMDKENEMDKQVRRVILAHYLMHDQAMKVQEAQQKAEQQRADRVKTLQGAEAGGTPSEDGASRSPIRGGFQTNPAGENPGPPDARKQPRPGTASSRMTNQSEQTAFAAARPVA